jgi:hypothetical protein
MRKKESLGRCVAAFGLALAVLALPAVSTAQLGVQLPSPVGGLLPGSSTGTAQAVVGQAAAVRVTILSLLGGTTTALADTGTLGGINDARDAAVTTGSLPSGLTGEVLSAATMSWSDQVDSVASLANLNMTIAGVGITADSVMAQASQVAGAAGSGSATFSNLTINGVAIPVTGAPNQAIWIPGGLVTINEQNISSTGAATVNALHVAITGVADVVIASATAGIS